MGRPDGLASPLGGSVVVVFQWTVVFLDGDDVCGEGVKEREGVCSFGVALHAAHVERGYSDGCGCTVHWVGRGLLLVVGDRKPGRLPVGSSMRRGGVRGSLNSAAEVEIVLLLACTCDVRRFLAVEESSGRSEDGV